MLHAMIRYVGPMLAGDFTRVSVFFNGRLLGSFRGKPQRDDESLSRLADHVTHGAGGFASYGRGR
jgi:hypothetical protein